MTKKVLNKNKDLEEVYRLMRKYKVNYTKTIDFEVTINDSAHKKETNQKDAIGFGTE